jgi:hypothetical protein
MKIFNTAKFLGIVLLTVVLAASSGAADKKKTQGSTPSSPNVDGSKFEININNISTVLWNNGFTDIDRQDANSGFVFPKGSRKTAVFKSGFIWGGKVGGQVRVGGSTYRTGLQPGKILPSGLPDDPALQKYRLFRVRPDYRTASLASEVADEGLPAATIRAQYETDWNEWPAADGAPYTDVDSSGTYDPAIDIPGVPGADQTLWFVCNDLNATLTTNLYGSSPMGLELQVTCWGYAQQGALGNMIFRKYLLINKGTNTIDSMYVSQWSDIDLGDSNDDFSGCDTTLSLGYVYNAFESDATYTPLPPPAVGFDFFQGPLVSAPGDSGIFLGKRVYDKANLPMTAHYYFVRGDAFYDDPVLGSYNEGTIRFYNFIRGRVGRTGLPFVDPQGNQTTFVLAGDPTVTPPRGWVDGQVLPAGDRRMGLASGPFVMAPGDTQEVVVAEIAAGAIPGVSRLSAIKLLKFYDKAAQLAYDNFFNIPPPPPAPQITVTEANQEVIFVWGSNPTAVNTTEHFNAGGFAFEGYNVYQLPSASAGKDAAVRIATYDLANGVQRILDEEFDPVSAEVIKVVKQFGSDAGIKRSISIKTDALRGNTPLINGIRYYFAITAYSFNPDPNAVPNNLENPLAIITVVPHSPNPGVRYNAAAGDTIPVSHTSTGALSEGTVTPLVVDPGRISGDSYQVTFSVDTTGPDPVTKWTYKNTTKNITLLADQENQSGDDDYLIIDGMQVKVAGPPEGMKDWDIPSGTRRFTFADADPDGGGFHLEGFEHSIGWAHGWFSGTTLNASQLKNVLLKLATAPSSTTGFNTNPGFATPQPYAGWDRETTTDENMSYAYRYLRLAGAAPARPEFAPFIVNPTAGQYAYQDYKKGLPWSAWDVEADPPRRLAVGFLENNVALGMVDGCWWPIANGQGVTNLTVREWFFIFDMPYTDSTPVPALQQDILNVTLPIMWWGLVNRRGGTDFPAPSGVDQFLILANHPNTPADVFAFNTSAYIATQDAALAKQDVSQINVFPNPYYGVNSEEINKYQRFVTFTHLPQRAKIRIFNLAGVLVRTINHDPQGATPGGTQFERWDLSNESGLPVGSGLYIAHIDMPDLGATKILKIAVVQEQQVLDRF